MRGSISRPKRLCRLEDFDRPFQLGVTSRERRISAAVAGETQFVGPPEYAATVSFVQLKQLVVDHWEFLNPLELIAKEA